MNIENTDLFFKNIRLPKIEKVCKLLFWSIVFKAQEFYISRVISALSPKKAATFLRNIVAIV